MINGNFSFTDSYVVFGTRATRLDQKPLSSSGMVCCDGTCEKVRECEQTCECARVSEIQGRGVRGRAHLSNVSLCRCDEAHRRRGIQDKSTPLPQSWERETQTALLAQTHSQ